MRPSTYHSVATPVPTVYPTQLPSGIRREHNGFFHLHSFLLAFLLVAVAYNVTITYRCVLQMDNALFEQLEIWLSPKHEEGEECFSNQESSTQDVWQPGRESDQGSSENPQTNMLEVPRRREEGEADEKNVPLTVICPNSQFEQMDRSISRWNNSTLILCFYRTQVYLESDLWVQVSETNYNALLKY